MNFSNNNETRQRERKTERDRERQRGLRRHNVDVLLGQHGTDWTEEQDDERERWYFSGLWLQ